jgi:DNA mismatch repair protein MutS2
MLKNTYKKGVGIVHGSSNTGRTIYVEPMEIVEPTNEMKSVHGQIRAEENKILFEMCQMISQYREEIKSAVTAAAEIDVLRAKAKLGARIRGVIPEVGDDGSMRCIEAKHPVLLLRGVDPVGNNIELDGQNRALVISGPNAGGKTVVLKTAGLFALMAKHAIPLPTRPGARVDFMQVMADIGDMQTVSGDLSTFSGHLVVCREMLKHAKSYSGNSLVLLDEIGTGTDPAQGAALAQAVLEELIDLGTRVIVTTHYQRIKELAAEDERFQIAAMEFIDNRPTYRLRVGSVGESYALEAGRRMRLPENVLERANLLLDDESRRILALQKRLEEETDRARQRQLELEAALRDLTGRETAIERSKALLEEQIKKLREGKTEEFLVDLRAKEKDLDGLIKKAQDAAMKMDLTRSERERAVEEVKREVKAARTETETKLVEQNAEDLATPLVAGEPIDEGTTLIVLEKGTIFGSRGIVTQRNKGRGRIFLRVAGVEVKMDRHLLGRPHQAGKMGFLISGGANSGKAGVPFEETLSAKDRRMRQMLMEELVDPDKQLMDARKQRSRGGNVASRQATNSLDLRDKSFDEGQVLATTYFERSLDNQVAVVYINHGGKKEGDANKTRLRTWLKQHPFVRRISSAEDDAFTLVELDFDE